MTTPKLLIYSLALLLPAALARAAPQTPVPRSGANTAAVAAAAGHATLTDVLGADEQGAAAPAARSAGAARARRIAVYDLKLEGVESGTGAVVTESLLCELRKLQGISAIGMDEIRDMLAFEQAKDALGCDDVTCLAEIGGALGADDLITGRLAVAAGEHVLLLRRIDQLHAQPLGTFNQRLEPGDGQEFLAAIGPAVAQLFPDQPLRPGATRGVDERVAMRLHPPPLPTWSFWTVTGTAVAGAAVGGGFALLARSAKQDYDAAAALSTSRVVSAELLQSKRTTAELNASRANTLFIASGGVALAAAVMALFTDWHGYAAAGAAH